MFVTRENAAVSPIVTQVGAVICMAEIGIFEFAVGRITVIGVCIIAGDAIVKAFVTAGN